MQLVPLSWTNLVKKLAVLSQQQSTGELILSCGDDQWHLYLLFGRLLYATGGNHRVRRWHRGVRQYCLGCEFDVPNLSEDEPWECQLLRQALNQNQISLTQAKSVISNSIHEVLFALASCAELSSLWLSKKQRPIALLEMKEFIVIAQQLWQEWQAMGLEQLCPDQAPIFKQPLTELSSEIDETSFSLLELVNGTYTIWDIALEVRQPVTVVASTLHHLANQDVLQLQTVPDFFPLKASVSSPHMIASINDTALTHSFVGSKTSLKTIHQVVINDELAQQIQSCVQEQFTGYLDIEEVETGNFASLQGVQQWRLDFCRGHLIGCRSSRHPMRRWYRQLSQYCPELTLDAIAPWLDQPQCWGYNCFAQLVRQGKILQGQRAAKQVIEGLITEILFDIHQSSEQIRYRSGLQLTYRRVSQKPTESAEATLVLIQFDQAWQQAMQGWGDWQQAGLMDYSPNLAPVILEAEELQKQTSSLAYHNLTNLVDGNQTLRDLALKLKQNLLVLTQSIMPYIHQGLMQLVEVEDFSSSVKPLTNTSSGPVIINLPVSPVQTQPTGSLLVAYIDDSQSDSLKMSHILTQAGYRFVNVQDAVKALPVLLEQKPDLILLDLVMPIANGYEICQQIRRVSVFKDTPVIIVTSNDGIVDRVRAKVAGSSGFLAKPIDTEKVLKVLQRYLLAPKSVPSQRAQTF